MMFRRYTPSDLEALIMLLRLNTPRYFDPAEEHDFEYYLDHHVQEYFVIEEAGKIIGCGGINYDEGRRTARLSWDIVHPDHYGKGIGSQLTRFRIDTIQANSGIEKIIVRTTQLAYRFYEKQGFTLKEVEKDYWAPGFDLYFMEMDAEQS